MRTMKTPEGFRMSSQNEEITDDEGNERGRILQVSPLSGGKWLAYHPPRIPNLTVRDVQKEEPYSIKLAISESA